MDYDGDSDRRIAELERQLAEAKASAGRADPVSPSWSYRANSTGGRPLIGTQQRRRTRAGANVIGGVAGAFGICVGGAAALTAVFPSSALWTSGIVCGGRDQLMVNTSHYSYKPGQSGTSVDFQCLRSDGAHDASFFAISGLQTIVVALVLAGAVAVGLVVRRKLRRQPTGSSTVIVACGMGVVSLAITVGVLLPAIESSAGPVQMPHGGSVTVHGNGETKAFACNDGHLTITGRAETVTVTGHCARISVDGVIHHITVDSVDAIDLDGLNNVLTYHSGTPTITKSGFGNTVAQG